MSIMDLFQEASSEFLILSGLIVFGRFHSGLFPVLDDSEPSDLRPSGPLYVWVDSIVFLK